MLEDPHLIRFSCYISLFTFFMLMLVSSENLIQLFFGWEGVGLCSYLLINFWYTRLQANKAAIQALMVNKIGDIGVILAISAVFLLFRSVDFSVIFVLTPYFLTKTFSFFTYSFSGISVIGFLLFIGAVGKSAQLGLHTWLPSAMEGERNLVANSQRKKQHEQSFNFIYRVNASSVVSALEDNV